MRRRDRFRTTLCVGEGSTDSEDLVARIGGNSVVELGLFGRVQPEHDAGAAEAGGNLIQRQARTGGVLLEKSSGRAVDVKRNRIGEACIGEQWARRSGDRRRVL